jgi:hypothetical protein
MVRWSDGFFQWLRRSFRGAGSPPPFRVFRGQFVSVSDPSKTQSAETPRSEQAESVPTISSPVLRVFASWRLRYGRLPLLAFFRRFAFFPHPRLAGRSPPQHPASTLSDFPIFRFHLFARRRLSDSFPKPTSSERAARSWSPSSFPCFPSVHSRLSPPVAAAFRVPWARISCDSCVSWEIYLSR